MGEGVGLLEHFDGFAGLRNGLRRLADGMGEWAGIPMPIDDMSLVIDPRYPNAAKLMELGVKEMPPVPEDYKLRNTFWSWRYRSTIVIYEEHGKVLWGKVPGIHRLGHDLSTLGASDVWGIEQEAHALQTLGTLVRHRQLKQYLLTGMFIERSERSEVHYLFRKLKPTVALSLKGEHPKVLAALCLHPIAYYENSWAGAMSPTDDVIAHLMLMRGDEPMLWRRANQHPAWTPEAGL